MAFGCVFNSVLNDDDDNRPKEKKDLIPGMSWEAKAAGWTLVILFAIIVVGITVLCFLP